MDFWYQLAKSIVQAYAAVFIKGIEVEGMDNLVPGPKIIVANHAYASDGFTLPLIMKEKLHFLMQSETFAVPILGHLLSRADQIPVARWQGKDALKIAKDRLSQGNCVVIFPEGELNHGGDLHPPNDGAVLLSILSKVPITPVGFFVLPENTRIFFGRYRKSEVHYQFSGKCFVHIGKPIQFEFPSCKDGGRRNLQPLSSHLMLKIKDLVQQANEAAHSEITSHS